jgi:hypothetical protein
MDAPTGSGRVLAAVFAGIAVLIAGCAASSPPSGQTAPTSPSAPATPSPTAPAAAVSCNHKVLSVLLLGRTKVAADTAYYPIEFQNISSTPCTLYGFPRVFFTGKNYSTRVGSVATSNQASPEHLITLPADGSAIAVMSVVNVSKYSSGCGQTAVSALLVRPPGLTNSVQLPFNGMTCVNPRYHVLTVDAVVTGPASVGD